MKIVGWLAVSGLLAGCVPYPPEFYGEGLQAGPYPGYYAQGYGPSGYYAPPGLIPLPEASPQTPQRVARPAARVRAAVPLVTAAAPVPASPAKFPLPGAAEASAPVAAAGPECRTVTQVGYVDGKEVQRQERFCRTSPGKEWVRS